MRQIPLQDIPPKQVSSTAMLLLKRHFHEFALSDVTNDTFSEPAVPERDDHADAAASILASIHTSHHEPCLQPSVDEAIVAPSDSRTVLALMRSMMTQMATLTEQVSHLQRQQKFPETTEKPCPKRRG